MNHLVDVLKERCRTDADNAAFLVKRDDRWEPTTWADVDAESDRIAAALLAIGLEKADSVCILSSTRLEWTLSDLGIIKAGGVSIGIYQTLSGEQAAYILADSQAKFLFIEDPGQAEKILPHLPELPHLQKIILFDGRPQNGRMVAMDAFLQQGADKLASAPDCVNEVISSIAPEDLALIIYTSGTTGPPKGAMLTHKNFLAELAATDAIDQEHVGDLMMFFLPLSHVGERIAQFMRIRRGITGAYVKDITKILDDIREIRPTFFGSVPRIFEKAYSRIRAEVDASPAWKQRLFAWAEQTGRAASRHIQEGSVLPPGLKVRYRIADKLVLSKIRDLFGGRVRYFLSSAAPISTEILEFFHACGMTILEGYGQTEISCFCTLCTPDAYRFGSVGKALPGVALKTDEDGEILVKGDIVFPGYHNQTELNAKILTADGWIRTGDLGRIDDNGYLWITGRKKDIIITSGGKNVTPSNIEHLIMGHPLIEHAMVHGDRRKYLTALISLSPENLKEWGKASGYTDSDHEALTRLPEVTAEVQRAVDEANAHLAKFETVKKFVILPKPFDIETGELTPTMKVRRRQVEDKYIDLLDALYAEN
ncbi:MAG: long-chain fatty acid--CoA ligase [Desulfobacterales bacterium]|nr:long-chain fatty acid--CoA ligase [Desulfobacterales bacterium]